jgi:type VI secretion system protein ImpJ
MSGRMKKIPDPVQWDQGMLLTPKHFLELAGRYEMLQQNMTLLQRPFNWGVVRFEYDRARLGAGTVAVKQLEAVLPDGTLVSATETDIEPLSLDKTPMGMQEVHLAVPEQRDFVWEGSSARYQPQRGTDAIPRLRPMLHLANTLPPARFVSMPLMRLKFDTEFVNSFEPPWMVVPASSALLAICADVVAEIRSKISFLIARINSGDSLTGLPDMRDRLRDLVSGLPGLEALLYAREVDGDGETSGLCYPFSLYQALCSVAGHVGLMSRDLAPPDFQSQLYRYNHRDLLACFTEVARYIHAAIDYGVSEAWDSFTLHVESERGFCLDPLEALADGNYSGSRWPSLVIGLRVGPGQEKHRILQWGERCLIATGEIGSKLQNRTLGAGRELWVDPPDLAPPPGVLVFALAKDHALDLGRTLHLVGDPARPAEAILYVRRSQENRD